MPRLVKDKIMPKTILDDINDGIMRLPKSGKKYGLEKIEPLPNAPYKTPEQMKKDHDKAMDDWVKSEKIPPKLNPTRKDLLDELKNEKVAPPRDSVRKKVEIFTEGVVPPADSEMPARRKGGKISLKDCKVNTAETRNSKHKSW